MLLQPLLWLLSVVAVVVVVSFHKFIDEIYYIVIHMDRHRQEKREREREMEREMERGKAFYGIILSVTVDGAILMVLECKSYINDVN